MKTLSVPEKDEQPLSLVARGEEGQTDSLQVHCIWTVQRVTVTRADHRLHGGESSEKGWKLSCSEASQFDNGQFPWFRAAYKTPDYHTPLPKRVESPTASFHQTVEYFSLHAPQICLPLIRCASQPAGVCSAAAGFPPASTPGCVCADTWSSLKHRHRESNPRLRGDGLTSLSAVLRRPQERLQIVQIKIRFRSMPALRPRSFLGCRVWILLTVIHLTTNYSLCAPVGQGLALKLVPRPVPRLRSGSVPNRDAPSSQHWRTLGTLHRSVTHPVPLPGKVVKGLKLRGQRLRRPLQKRHLCPECQAKYSSSDGDLIAFLEESKVDAVRSLSRPRRQLKWDGYDSSQDSRTTTVEGYIDWGPTGDEDEGEDEVKIVPNTTMSTKALTTTVASITTTTATRSPGNPQRTYAVVTTMHPRRLSTTQPSVSFGVTVKPPKPMGDTPGLAVHQIITITVSLIMVIAALITTLVLKNCCAQSGNGRHSSHQRKINQQEESCQNLTDFTPARVPSKMDIFSAYNDSLQCSHECVRPAVSVYTDEMIQHTPMYKTAYNGNRPSPTERQLIPVAFVSDKWFEISC
ncbi:adherens junction-associated protein 1 [Chanos chanos]|uniref:Adherens junction-associated protein 1 n=1 Tax=Chanos chanos TaxID=29144 RepID=A0A6J2WA21_CHACN|nr:adherens junction-associated protein 1 [Chanos chanos]